MYSVAGAEAGASKTGGSGADKGGRGPKLGSTTKSGTWSKIMNKIRTRTKIRNKIRTRTKIKFKIRTRPNIRKKDRDKDQDQDQAFRCLN